MFDQEITIHLPDTAATENLGARIAGIAETPVVMFLSGQLAAGKTTFTRGFLRARGHAGAVKSPTFTLVESYELQSRALHHFDLYRIEDAEELEYIGLDEYFTGTADCLVEWPERGADVLPPPDLHLHLSVVGQSRDARVLAATMLGRELLQGLI